MHGSKQAKAMKGVIFTYVDQRDRQSLHPYTGFEAEVAIPELRFHRAGNKTCDESIYYEW